MSGKSKPRILFMAMPPPAPEQAVQAAIARHRIDRRLRGALSSAMHWHQSFSDRIFSPSAEEIAALLRVGSIISAHACTLQFDRIDSSGDEPGKIHCTLRARGRPKAFDDLALGVKTHLENEGFSAIATGVTPHVTLSYCASERIDRIELDPPIAWTINELLLVIGGGEPFGYDIIGRWPLLPEIDPPATQTGLS